MPRTFGTLETTDLDCIFAKKSSRFSRMNLNLYLFFFFFSAQEIMMDSIDDSVLSTDLGDVETDTMSPLAAPTNEVSELEQEAEALGTVSMESDEANESEDTTSQGKTIASREDLRSGGG